MNKLILKKIIINIIILLIIFLLDRISKFYILNIAEAKGVVDIYINSFLQLILIWNTGIGFGLAPMVRVSWRSHATISISTSMSQ